METTKQIEIPLSKSNIKTMLLGCIVFVGLGIWFVTYPPKSSIPLYGNPIVIFVAGLASILFFGFVGYSLLRKLSDKNPGLIVSSDGIYHKCQWL